MTSPKQALQSRKPHLQPGPTHQHRPSRLASFESGSDLKSALLTVSVTLLISFLILRQLDLFSSGKWQESEHVRYIISDEDRDAFQARMKTEKEGPLVIAFYSETCLACRRMKRPFVSCAEEVEEVAFFAAQVSDAKNYDLAKQFNVKRIPAIIVVNSSGENPSQKLYDGRPDRKKLIQFVKETSASHHT